MALPQDGQNANGLTKVTEIPKGKELIFIDPTTNEGGIITFEDLTTQILKNLTSQTFALDQGTMTLLQALNQLNSDLLPITLAQVKITNAELLSGSNTKNSIDTGVKIDKSKIIPLYFACTDRNGWKPIIWDYSIECPNYVVDFGVNATGAYSGIFYYFLRTK